MARPKAKPGAHAAYWVPGLKLKKTRRGTWVNETPLTKTLRRVIAGLVGKQPEEFYVALENITTEFKVYSAYLEQAPTLANVRVALEDLRRRTQELSELISGLKRIDDRTRQMIEQKWALLGNEYGVVERCSTAVGDLWAAVEATATGLQVPKGRGVDANREFARDLWLVFEHFKLKPKAEQTDAYECTLALLLSAAGQATAGGNVHRLALLAAQ